jgi:hypothetical protein
MISMFFVDDQGRLIRRFAGETLCIEAWGESSLRVRAVQYGCELDGHDGALMDKPEGKAQITIQDDTATIVNGRIRAEITKGGKLVFYNQKGEKLLEEFARQRKGSLHPVCIVDYDRFAFTYPVEDVRITLDMDVRTRPYSTELFNRYLPTVPVMDEGECVLEVKYNGFLPSHIMWMLEGVPKQRMAVSKYVKCMSVLE